MAESQLNGKLVQTGDTEALKEDSLAVDTVKEPGAPEVELGTSTKLADDASKEVISTPLSDEEKKKLRAERFGLDGNDNSSSEQQKDESQGPKESLSAVDKKKLRAERFGIPITPALIDPKKEQKGAKNQISNAEKNSLELEKRKQRAERFGLDFNLPAQKANKLGGENTIKKYLELPKAKALEMFVTGGSKPTVKQNKAVLSEAELEKRKQRAERFGLNNQADGNEEKKRKTESEGPGSASTDVDAKKAKRLDRFGAEALKNEVKKAAASSAATPKPPGTSAAILGVKTPAGGEQLSEKEAEEREKRLKRAQRFGLPVATSEDADAKKKLRAERFAPLVNNNTTA